MRFVKPRAGDTRRKTFFVWFPVKIGNETSWLEKVTIRQTAVRVVIHSDILDDVAAVKWHNTSFIDKEKKSNG